jgi:hypothetical protein
MATLDSIQDFHDHLDLVCSSLEKLSQLASDEHHDFIMAAQPAMLLFRELLDAGAQQGWAR